MDSSSVEESTEVPLQNSDYSERGPIDVDTELGQVTNREEPSQNIYRATASDEESCPVSMSRQPSRPISEALAELVSGETGQEFYGERLNAALDSMKRKDFEDLVQAAKSDTGRREPSRDKLVELKRKFRFGHLLGISRPKHGDRLNKVPEDRRTRLDKEHIKLSGEQKLELVGRLLEYRSGTGQTFQEKLASELEIAGVELPTILVQYNNLSVESVAKEGGEIESVSNAIGSGLSFSKAKHRKMLLQGATGALRPGRATLLVGPPGGGKSVFMKALSGRLKGGPRDVKVTGELLYNGHRQDEFIIENSSAYVEQLDNHFPTLTVRETLEFAKKCQRGFGEGSIVKTVKKLLESREKKRREGSAGEATSTDLVFEGLLQELNGSGPVVVDYVLKLMGLDGCQDTVVGDAMLRGISGGQKKRVTTAEMLVGFTQLLLMDEISTGLDSATTFQVALFITNYTHAMSCTTVVGLLQPPPETVALFDDIMIIAEGRIVYHGPAADTLPFLKSLGFHCPPRKDMGAFLQEVFTPQGQLEYCEEGMRPEKEDSMDDLIVPVDGMQDAYWRSEAGKRAAEAAAAPFDRSRSHPDALRNTKYALNAWEAFSVLLWRQGLLLSRNKNLMYTRAGFAIVTGLILGTVFFQLRPDPDYTRPFFGLFYLICMYFALGNLPQVAITYNAKSIYYKHKNNNFFPGWIYVAVQLVVHVPFALAESMLFGICLYFLAGLTLDGPQYFFIWWLIAFSTHVSMAAMFRLIANISPSLVRASSIASVALLVNILTSGYTIVFGDIPPWWVWVYWVSPFAYAIRSFVINEMGSPRWGDLGDDALRSYDFATAPEWVWIGIGFQWAFTAAVVMASSLILTLLDTRSPHQVRISDKQREQAIVQAKTELRRAKLLLRELNRKSAASVSSFRIDVKDDEAASPSFVPVSLVWKDLKYVVKTPAGSKLELLKGISGFARPRRLTALMGGSGAGKTTLMDVISGRKTQGEIQGELLVNGHPKVQSSFARVMGYVEQTDIHSPQTTVREALVFSAALRLSRDTTAVRRNELVQSTIRMVELDLLQESLVGVPGVSGLSGEQRKRLTIAVELVANPSVVFLDEPTSGLDSTAAGTVVRAMRTISENGRTVMATIHQPSIEIFSAFDALVLLKRGGRLIFFGELGEGCGNLISYLESQPSVDPILDGYNPATWMLEVSGKDVTVEGETMDFADLYQISDLKQDNDKQIEQELKACEGRGELGGEAALGSVPWSRQFQHLLSKYLKMYWRSPSYNITRMIVIGLMALMYGSIYWQQGALITAREIPENRVQNLMGVIFSSITFVAVFQLTAIQPIIAYERTVYMREQAAKMYSVWPKSAAQTLVELPFLLIQAVIFVPILYFMVGFVGSASKFFFYFLVNFVSLSLFTFFGEWLVYVTPNQQLAQVFGAGLNQVWNIMCGFLVAFPLIPVWWKWFNRATPSTWLIYALAASQLGDSEAEVLPAVVSDSAPARQSLGEYMEESFGFAYRFHWPALVISLVFVLFFRVTSTLALRYINFASR